MLRIESSKKMKTGKQAGFIVTVELLLITVVLVVGLVTGMTKLRDQTIAELSDTGSAIGSINQSYTVQGTEWSENLQIAATSGFAFADAVDLETATSVGGDGSLVVYTGSPAASTSDTALETPQYVQ